MSEAERKEFLRQRRNLLVISIIVFLVEAADVSLKGINLSGVQFNIGRPDIIYSSLWLALLYWLVRYYQYFNGHPADEIITRINGRMDWTVPRACLRKFLKEGGVDDLAPSAQGNLKVTYDGGEIVKKEPNKWMVKLSVNISTGQGDTHVNYATGQRLPNQELSGRSLSWEKQ